MATNHLTQASKRACEEKIDTAQHSISQGEAHIEEGVGEQQSPTQPQSLTFALKCEQAICCSSTIQDMCGDGE